MPLPEWIVRLVTPPHEAVEYALALCAVLVVVGFVVALLGAPRRRTQASGSTNVVRYRRHQHREWQRAVAQQQPRWRRLRWPRNVKAVALGLVGLLVLVGWWAREDGHPVAIRRGNALASAPSDGGGLAFYPNCSAARAVGAGSISVGEPGYRSDLDRDGDGVACEPWP